MNVVVRGRNVEVPDHFRSLVEEKLASSEKLDSKIIGIDVELYHEPNPRQHDASQRVEITCRGRGPVVRAEACSADFYTALDLAVGKLESRLRRAHSRRLDRPRGGRSAEVAALDAVAPGAPGAESDTNGGAAVADQDGSGVEERYDLIPGRVVRVKEHVTATMGVEDALFEMELVGHDFYLFHDVDSDRPSVVYRRKGYDYGLIRLSL